MPTVDYEQQLSRLWNTIQNSEEISDHNRALFSRFKRDLRTEDYSAARIHKLLSHLKILAEWADFDFEDATEDDLRDAVAWIQSRGNSAANELDYKVVIKRFWRWMNGGEHPEIVNWIDTTPKKTRKKLPEDLLTEDDILDLLDASTNPRTAAFVAILWETGARPGELIDLVIKDLQDHEYGLQAVISGKTGPRRLPLISSVLHLNRWLDAHPRRDERDAPLWVQFQAQDHGHGSQAGEKASYDALRRDLERTAKRAEIQKDVNPYQFRHSRATHLANRFTEAQMCEWFGWVQGSRMPAKYVHLAGRDIDQAYGKLHGKVTNTADDEKVTNKTCPRCALENRAEARFCDRCGAPLDPETALTFHQEEADAKKKLIEALSPQEFQALALEALENQD